MRLCHFVPGMLLAAGLTCSAADLVVVVNRDSGVDRLTREEVANLFLGRYGRMPSGLAALPVDATPDKQAFYERLVGKQLPELQSYWARLMFSGRGSPPRQVDSAEEALEIVRNNKGAIAYVERAKADARVRVVLELGR